MGCFKYHLEKECFFGFSLLIINEGEVCGVRSTKTIGCKMFAQVPIIFTNLLVTIWCS